MNRSIARHISLLLIAVMLVTTLGVGTPGSSAHALPSSITVNTTADELNSDGDCSLREAIQSANTDTAVDACAAGSGTDTINIPAGTYTLTIAGANENGNASGDLDISSDLSIQGAGAASTIIEAGTIGYPSPSANGIDGVLHITGINTVTIDGLTIANGKGASGITTSFSGGSLTVTNSIFSGNASGLGGAIANYGLSSLSVSNTTISNNNASSMGGGIYTQSGATTIASSSFLNNTAAQGGALTGYSVMTVVNSTFSGNSSTQYAGALYFASTTASVTNSTISDNTAGSMAWSGGLFINGGTLHLNNTILANNMVSGTPGDCRKNSGGETVDGTNNLIENDGPSQYGCGSGTTSLIGGLDPKLAPLSGSPAYFELTSDSPAINAGDDTVCAAAPVSNASQNGATRPMGAHCEIGSYEGAGLSAPVVQLDSTFLYFGMYEVGTTSSAQMVTVTNIGNATLNISPLGVSGDFGLVNDNCSNANLAVNGTCTFETTFSPTSTGPLTGAVSVPSNAATSPDVVSLAGSGFTTGSSTFTSAGASDGYIIESGENTSVGGTVNATLGVSMVGDYFQDRQVISILHFDTSSLPDNASVTSVFLRIKRQSVLGTNPFLTHGSLFVDFASPFFGAESLLKPADFQNNTNTTKFDQGPFSATLISGSWYEADLTGGWDAINLTGATQLRLHFSLDDNDDNGPDLLRFFSGNYPLASYRPVLIVNYILP